MKGQSASCRNFSGLSVYMYIMKTTITEITVLDSVDPGLYMYYTYFTAISNLKRISVILLQIYIYVVQAGRQLPLQSKLPCLYEVHMYKVNKKGQ